MKKEQIEKDAKLRYLKNLFEDYNKTIIFDSKINDNLFTNFNSMRSSQETLKLIPWNSLFFIYTYMIWNSQKQELIKGVLKKTFNSFNEYDIFNSYLGKDDIHGYALIKAVKKFNDWEIFVKTIEYKEDFDILVLWLSDTEYAVGTKNLK